MLTDLRYALRQLRAAPGFALAATLTLAVGIGANATVFSVVDALLLRPTPHVREPDRLVALYTSDYSGPAYGTSAYPDVDDFARAGREAGVLAALAAFAPRPAAIGDAPARERILLEAVSPAYLDVLGVAPALGRTFSDAEGRGADASAVVISDALWRRRFGADPGAVGRTLPVNGRPATIVGVLPPRFAGSTRGVAVDVWTPLAVAVRLGVEGIDARDFTERGSRAYNVVGRLAPGATVDAAQRAMDVVARRLHAAYPDLWTDVRDQGRKITVLAERAARVPPALRGPVLAFTALLGATVALVLLVCCANVAGLLLARGTARGRELGVRLALGARPGRLARQLLTESMVLAALGTALALLATAWATRALARLDIPVGVPVSLDVAPDWRLAAFSAALAAVAAAAFGLAPALRAARTDVATVMRAGGSYGAAARRTRLQGALVVGQLATSLVLLVGALLFVDTVRAAAAVDPGFSARSLLLADLEPTPGRDGAPSSPEAARRVRERLAATAGVEAVSWAASVPLGGGFSRRGTTVQGYRPAAGEDMEFPYNVVGPAYFETIGVALARGRGFGDADREGAPPVVVVNEAFARRFWPGRDPLGQRVSFRGPDGPYAEVVGVARDGRYRSLADAPRPYVYLPALQEPGGAMVLHVRTAGDPRAALPAVREAVAAVPGWDLVRTRTLREHVAASLLPQRVAGGVLAAAGGIALLLAAVGVYGVVAHATARRTREIGVRVALGARRGDVVWMVVRQSLGLVLWGLAIGLPLAWAAARAAASLLVGTAGADAAAFAGGALVLGGAATLAAWLPARRAARLDPFKALRAE